MGACETEGVESGWNRRGFGRIEPLLALTIVFQLCRGKPDWLKTAVIGQLAGNRILRPVAPIALAFLLVPAVCLGEPAPSALACAPLEFESEVVRDSWDAASPVAEDGGDLVGGGVKLPASISGNPEAVIDPGAEDGACDEDEAGGESGFWDIVEHVLFWFAAGFALGVR